MHGATGGLSTTSSVERGDRSPLAGEARVAALEGLQTGPVTQSLLDLRAVSRPISPTHLLAKWVRLQRCTLLVAGVPEAPEVLLSEWVLLPAIAAAAELSGDVLLGLRRDTQLVADERALFGIRVVTTDISADGAGSIRAALWVDAATTVLGLREGEQIECAELIDTYMDGDLLRAAARGG